MIEFETKYNKIDENKTWWFVKETTSERGYGQHHQNSLSSRISITSRCVTSINIEGVLHEFDINSSQVKTKCKSSNVKGIAKILRPRRKIIELVEGPAPLDSTDKVILEIKP